MNHVSATQISPCQTSKRSTLPLHALSDNIRRDRCGFSSTTRFGDPGTGRASTQSRTRHRPVLTGWTSISTTTLPLRRITTCRRKRYSRRFAILHSTSETRLHFRLCLSENGAWRRGQRRMLVRWVGLRNLRRDELGSGNYLKPSWRVIRRTGGTSGHGKQNVSFRYVSTFSR